MKITKNEQKQINKNGQQYHLKLALIYGSFAKGKNHKDSDLDIAVLGKKLLDFKTILELSYEFTHIFKGIEVNVKSLHQVDPFFRYQVMQNSILIYGQPFDYHNFKTYAFRAYIDSKDLLRLENILAQKTLQYLRKSHA